MADGREGLIPLSSFYLEEGDEFTTGFEAFVINEGASYQGLARVTAILKRTVVYERPDGRKDLVRKDFVWVKEKPKVEGFDEDPKNLRQAGIRRRRAIKRSRGRPQP